jgi:hypothetical protein
VPQQGQMENSCGGSSRRVYRHTGQMYLFTACSSHRSIADSSWPAPA